MPPSKVLSAIGANIVFVGAVEDTLRGVGGDWDDVAIVEYPCPIAFFAMSTDPEFQARAVHKEAGMASTIVMVTHLEALQDVSTARRIRRRLKTLLLSTYRFFALALRQRVRNTVPPSQIKRGRSAYTRRPV